LGSAGTTQFRAPFEGNPDWCACYEPNPAGDWFAISPFGNTSPRFSKEFDAWEWIRQQHAKSDAITGRGALKVEFASEFQVEANLPLVDGWIDRGELVAVVGPPGSFKTTLAADMACCVAWEHPWMGCKTEGGSVLVVELEGARGFRNRVIAWHKFKALPHAAASIGMVSEGITLACGTDGPDTKRVIAAADAVAKKTGQPVRLIVVDTMSRAMGDKDEDKAGDISFLVQAMNEIQRKTGAAVLLIHHTGLMDGTRGRGSSNQRASWDVELLVEAKDNGHGTVKAQKQREKEKRAPLRFLTEVVQIGTRQDGKSVTARVSRLAVEGEVPAAEGKGQGKGPTLGKNEKLLLSVLEDERARWQPLPKEAAFPPEGLGMPANELRDAFYRRLPDDTKNKRDTWAKAWKALAIDHKLIGMVDSWVWRKDQPITA
jgi:energy-coupling factor transporter ATP-binding protein EcfA2